MKKDHLEVLLEDMNSKFALVLEGHAVLGSQIADLAHRTEERFDLMDFKIDALKQRVDGLDHKVDVLERKVDALDKKVDGVAADLSAHRADTEAHPGVYRVKEEG